MSARFASTKAVVCLILTVVLAVPTSLGAQGAGNPAQHAKQASSAPPPAETQAAPPAPSTQSSPSAAQSSMTNVTPAAPAPPPPAKAQAPIPTTPVTPTPAPVATTDKNTVWTPNPATVLLGGQTDIIVTAPPATCSDPNFDKSLDNPTVRVQQGFRVTGITASHSGKCEITVTLAADKDAILGSLRLTITDQTGKIDLGLANVTVASVLQGAIPPGLTPQVDVTWHVVDPNVVEDNFGHRIRKLFYCVQLTVGNNTGYDLQIASVGFSMGRDVSQAVGNTDYSMVRGSMDWGHKTNLWSLASLTVQASVPVLTAALPLVADATKRAHRSELINLFSPVATAMTFIYPYQDSFTAQFKHLDDSSLRANFVIHNNQQAPPVFVFVAKKSLPAVSKNEECKDSQLDCIKRRLEKIVIVGDTITYLNRLSVVGAAGQTANAPSVALSATSLNFTPQKQGTAGPPQAFSLKNSGTAQLIVSNIALDAGAATSGFAQKNDCGTLPATLAVNASCTITVTLTPASVGDLTGKLTVTDNTAGSPHTINLTGKGQS